MSVQKLKMFYYNINNNCLLCPYNTVLLVQIFFIRSTTSTTKKRALLLSYVRWSTCNTTNTKTNIPANKQKTVNNWKYQHTALLFFHWVRCQRREYLSVSSFREPDPSNPLSTRKRTRTMPLVCIHLIHLLVAHSDFSFLFSCTPTVHHSHTPTPPQQFSSAAVVVVVGDTHATLFPAASFAGFCKCESGKIKTIPWVSARRNSNNEKISFLLRSDDAHLFTF